MRFMILRKADSNTESGHMPPRDMLAAMGQYRDEMIDAGVFLGGDALITSAKGARVKYAGGTFAVIDGPFAEAKELIAGFVLIEVDSLDQAVHWAKRCPSLCGSGEAEIEVRQVIESTDFPAKWTPELSRLPWMTVAQAAQQRLHDAPEQPQ